MYYNEQCDILTIEQLCEVLNIGKNTAYKLLNSREIRAFKISRTWKIPRTSVTEYICKKSNITPPPASKY